MLKDKHDIRVLRTEQGPPIIVLTATNGDTLYLQRSDATTDRLELKEAFATALVLRAASAQDASNYTGAIMPFVSIDREVSIDWLTQLKYAGTRYYVSQAKQQVRFKLTEKVAKVETETVVVNETRSSRPSGPVPYVLDDRFFAALVRKGETLPYFSAWIGQEDWVKAEQVAIKK